MRFAHQRTATRRRFLAGGLGALAATAVGFGGATPAGAQTSGGGLSLPTYLSRRDWDADESLRFSEDGSVDYPVAFYPIQKVTVHHTATWTPGGRSEAVGLVRAIYAEHVNLGYGDIGYHLLIDQGGTVYEGRYSGGISFPIYDVHPKVYAGAPWAVNGAHIQDFNAGNIGIAVLGNMHAVDITDAAWWSLVLTVALLMGNTGLDPHGESLYRNPISGTEKVLPNICTHRDVAATLCPGDSMVGWAAELRDSVAAALNRIDHRAWLA